MGPFRKMYSAVLVSLLAVAISVGYLSATGRTAFAVLAVAAIATGLYCTLKYLTNRLKTATKGAEANTRGGRVQPEQAPSEESERCEGNNQFFNSVLESLTYPFYVINANDYTIATANSATGIDKSAGPVTCYATTHKRDTPCNGANDVCPLEITKATRKPVTVEHIHYDKSGNPRHVEVHAYPILDADGNVSQVIECSLDISERRQAEEALRESEQKFKTIFDNTSDGIFLFDLEAKKFSTCNNACLQMLGYTQEDLMNLPIADLHPKEDLPFIYAQVEEFSKGRKGIRNDIRFKRKDRSVFFADLSPDLVMLGGKKYVLVAIKDISERKLAEQEQTQLLQQLEKANQELKDFAYIVSHDLKAPLRGVKVLVDWLSTDYADRLDEDGKEQMRLLTKRVDRMHNLIDGIMQYSRIGRVKEQNVKVDLTELLPEVIDLLAPPANITITTQANLPTILCDKTRISQVFQNLLSNAVKYMDKPQGEVKVACVQDDGFWKFSVADNGPGIEQRHFGKLFQMFQTLEARDDVESTGIGLALVKKIAEMYGGKTWVESQVGLGSTFLFTLPKQSAEVKDERPQTSAVG